MSTGLGRAMAFGWLAVLAFPLTATLDAHPPPVELVATLLAVALFVGVYARLVLSCDLPYPDRRGLATLGLLLAIAIGLTLGERVQWASLFIFSAAICGPTLREPLAAAGVVLCVLLAGVSTIAAGADPGSGLVLAGGTAGIGMLMLSIAGLRARNDELHRAREELARLAVADERLRFARDLHDLLGQSLSVIALKAELAGRLLDAAAGERAAQSPGVSGHGEADAGSEPAWAVARVHVGELEGVARKALSEVRETAGGYRRPVLARELEGARVALEAAGIEARLDRAGAKLAPDVEALLAWTVREGTTNVIRHSGASSCRVVIFAGVEAVSVEVLDDGRGPAGVNGSRNGAAGSPGEYAGAGGHGDRPGEHPGLGLAGLRERAECLAGEVEAGAGPGGGFRLRVSVPSAQSAGTAAA
ncbi:MAG TPA: histidine kinase [Solirubrobacteraceae bacterium]|nr:histidine kinase [Solirubrobacteraceae bacterium]